MCIAIMKPEGKVLSDEVLQNCWSTNSHGAGFAYVKNGKVVIDKGHMTLDSLKTALNAVGQSEYKMLIHFRIKTHGEISPQLTHPFEVVEGEIAMIHNGVISNLTSRSTKEKSDTALLAEMIGNAYPANNVWTALENPIHAELWSNYIGSGSKLVFLNSKNEHLFANEKAGQWDDGVWYSNSSFRSSWNNYSYNNYYYSNKASNSSSFEKKTVDNSSEVQSDVEALWENLMTEKEKTFGIDATVPSVIWEQRGGTLVEIKRFPPGYSGRKLKKN